jgi:polysaccharide biosynthesis transport protein
MAPESKNGRSLARVRGEAGPLAPRSRAYRGQVPGDPDGMEIEVRTLIDILRRRARLIVGIFLAVVAAAVLYTFFQTPAYRASALLEIGRGDGSVPSVASLFAEGDPTNEHLRTNFELLRSETLATRVVETLDLHEVAEFAPDEETTTRAIVSRFLDRLVIDPVAESRLVRVTFSAGSPELAALIVNEIVATFTILRTEMREEGAQRIAAQVEEVGRRLEQSEEALRQYTQENGLPYLVEEDITSEIGTRLRDLRTRLAEAQGVRYENQALYNVVADQGGVDIVEDAALRELESQLSGLRREYARLSSAFTDDYPVTADVLNQIQNVEGLIEAERARVAGRVGNEYQLALQRESMIAQAINEQEERANQLGPESGGHHILRQAVLANRALYVTLHERQRDAETAVAIGPTDFSVVDPAVPPTSPYRPVFAMTLGLAMMLGLVMGIGAAFARELMDDTLKTVGDLPRRMELPVLGLIPAHEGQSALESRARRRSNEGSWLRIDMLKKGAAHSNAIVDAFGTLRTAVLFRDGAPVAHSILVSSCRAGEGKTTVSVNLAMSLAKLGSRVLLVDADLRRPSVHRALGIQASPGLSDHLQGGSDWKGSIRFGVVPGLDVLPSGKETSRAADLLAGHGMDLLLRESEARYDFVIVDSPALFINAADATLLSRVVDGVLVVVRSNTTPKALVARLPEEVPNLMGVVVNDLQKGNMPDFGDYFAEYAMTAEEASPASPRSSRSAEGISHVARSDTQPERA